MVELKVSVEELASGFIVKVSDSGDVEGAIIEQDVAPTYKKAIVIGKRMVGDILTEKLERTEEEKQP